MSSRTLTNSGTPKTTLLSRETQGTHFEYLAFATGNLRGVAGGSRGGRTGGTDDRRQTTDRQTTICRGPTPHPTRPGMK